jgi:hypothetical protein
VSLNASTGCLQIEIDQGQQRFKLSIDFGKLDIVNGVDKGEKFLFVRSEPLRFKFCSEARFFSLSLCSLPVKLILGHFAFTLGLVGDASLFGFTGIGFSLILFQLFVCCKKSLPFGLVCTFAFDPLAFRLFIGTFFA